MFLPKQSSSRGRFNVGMPVNTIPTPIGAMHDHDDDDC